MKNLSKARFFLSSWLFAISILLTLVSNPVDAQVKENSVDGYWQNEAADMILEIYKSGEYYNGKIAWLRDSLDVYGQPLRDIMNNKPQQRSRLVVGVDMLKAFEWGDGDWKHGTIYNYKNGNSYNGKMSIDDEGTLRLTGYYSLLFFLGKTKKFTRVDEPGNPALTNDE